MKVSSSPIAILSDGLILIGCGLSVAAAWLLNWQAGMLVTGLALVALAVVLRGAEILGAGKRRGR